ncbi:hypothetical protein [Kribbella catacumbae]|uniref:hypothetical protein n=1 Tax=Kribbella catacumbae TaxID=460086 RepID=UPI0012FB2C14|nr:hypothetical protein [Kribbella catacumbae]
MSRHTEIDKVVLNAPARFSAIDWSNFIERSQIGDDHNPIDEFYSTHQGLTALGGLVGQGTIRQELEELLAGQMVLGYVSATELFLRRLLAQSVRLCPNLRKRNSSVQIPFGALDFYEAKNIEHALTERVTFSEPGKVANVLRERFGISIKPNSSLNEAIAEFEGLCQLRHALVHSRGVVNSTNAEQFELPAGKGHCMVTLEHSEVAAAGAVCMNLVREINTEVGRTILWDWLTSGVLRGTKRADSTKLGRLLTLFASKVDPSQGRATASTVDQLMDTARVVADAVTNSRLAVKSVAKPPDLSVPRNSGKLVAPTDQLGT